MSNKNNDYWQGDEGPQRGPRGGNNGPNKTPGPNRQGNNNGPNKSNPILVLILTVAALFIAFSLTQNLFNRSMSVPYSTFMQYVEDRSIVHAEIKDNREITFVHKSGKTGVTIIPYLDGELMKTLKANVPEVVGTDKGIDVLSLVLNLLPVIIMCYLLFSIYRSQGAMGGGMFGGMGKSLAREYKPDDKNAITFKDVAGQKEAKQELSEVVEFLKDPKKFKAIGARIPKGVLLVGPPGTGKTLIARAVAGEAKVSFLLTSGSDFVEMFVGMGAARVRDLFAEARSKQPCIVFIDELDAVGRSRGAGLGGGHDEREQTLNQMLVEMDGFETDTGIIVMAATNRPDVLDTALLRPGRFDRQVVVDLPDIAEREAILQIHFGKVKTSDDIDLKKLARATPGCSGADLANLANESALLAARFGKSKVTMAEVEKARDKILLGVARESKVMTMEEKTATSYHESGHALLHYYVKGVDPLHKVTIIPHGRALGLTMSLPEKDVLTKNRDNLTGWIKICMGGYVAEKLVYGQTTTGTSNDIQQATNIATKMVTEWGMSPLGFVNYGSDDQPLFLGREIASHKNFSDTTANQIDKEVRAILDGCMKEVTQILSDHRDQLDLLAQNLVAKETMDDSEVRALLGFEPVESPTSLS